MFTIAISAAILASAVAAPAGPPAPHHPAPAHYDESPKPYAFEYGVADDYAGTNFNQHETSDAKTTSGGYTVALPDGRTQIVTYTADPYGYGGFVADVQYEGHATYAEHKPAPYHPAPVHKPAPYHPAPVHKPAPYPPAPAYKPAPVYHA